MADRSIAARIETALAGASPPSALYELAKVLNDEGMSQQEMYRWFDKAREQHEHDPDQTKYDAILDAMDYIAGWCGPSARLFDSDRPT
jgi:hypothetical protein